ncbi:MAG: dCTP deaminase [Halobacteria archaeon]
MSILPDFKIREYALSEGMITPFCEDQITPGRLGTGLSCFGYDISLSPKEFKIFQHIPGKVVDPKAFDLDHLEPTQLNQDGNGRFFWLPAHSYGLGVAVEKLNIPDRVMVLAVGKSSYARCGVEVNLSPAEPGWQGYLTLELSNSSPSDTKVYANEGICQLVFLESEYGRPEQTYPERTGKYQNQPDRVVVAKVN